MQRQRMLDQAKNKPGYFDVIIIGGGATGLGAAVDSASRGYSTLLLEQHDFAKGTSSRSTKLVHGGVRYLQQGNVTLVLEALRERGLLIQNAPHLVRNQSFIVPNYDWWEGPFYGVGMKVYDMLAGKLGLGPSKNLSLKETIKHLPTLEQEGLRGGVIYYDGQFDDSRMAVNLAQTAAEHGALLVNYAKVTGLIKSNNMVDGVAVRDQLTGDEFELNARVVVNATGVFTDNVLKMDDQEARTMIAPSQGVHLVIDKEFSPGESAIMVPHTDDGRVLFAVPWNGKIVVGTTDTPVDDPDLEPKAMEEEIDFILKHATQYLTGNPTRKDVRSVFAGLRPLVKAGDGKDTASLSRDHTLIVSKSGLVTITGGKWTTYRKMAQDTIDQAATVAGLNVQECVTENLRIHGWLKNVDKEDPLYHYGSDRVEIEKLIKEKPELGEKLHERLPYLKAEVIWGVRNEMAMTVEDVLSRRTRALLLDAQASVDAAREVAELMAGEMEQNGDWIAQQVKEYEALADAYILK
ncbi:glycerol-3-phosphate dehydrogenase/oxidase [Rhodohalobacter mucosus]|uniref:FAD-dependent oxidoreductase n=1 Tax=Rhodohalobacter mucosus TaxID=2079485 RepID=A0A316TL76_9BACT|nr:glycerol-3-phosphate dehydrogenase/oxidase [Rhodohalobacter mucosus]PWN05120.1 FAD-dependent oxidoreductase [Rhodohalobacter mucosus]